MEEQEVIQTNQTQQPLGSLAPKIPNPLKPDDRITFENDFGENPVGLGYFTRDQGALAILTLAGAFVGAALGGLPFAGVILLAGLNDVRYAGRSSEKSDEQPSPPEEGTVPTLPEAVEVSAVEAHEDASQTIARVENTKKAPTLHSTKWVNNFVSQTALIWGNQGSGKSWMARYIASLKRDLGYRVVVLDPDSNRAEWQGVESYHDFDEIQEFLRWYVDELRARYKAFNASSMTEDAWRASLWASGKALSVICEEVTTYVDLLDDKDLLTQFFRLGLTKSRKQEMPLIFVSHNNTQSALGGIKGLANLIEKMLQLELQTDIDPFTLQPVASGKGAVKLDGSNQWVPVTLPKLERKITNFGKPHPTAGKQSVIAAPETETLRLDSALAPTEATTNLKATEALGEPLRTIWAFAKQQGDWVTVRDIQRKDFAILKGKGSEKIHQYLGLLSDSNYGEIDEEGKSHSSVRFKAS